MVQIQVPLLHHQVLHHQALLRVQDVDVVVMEAAAYLMKCMVKIHHLPPQVHLQVLRVHQALQVHQALLPVQDVDVEVKAEAEVMDYLIPFMVKIHHLPHQVPHRVPHRVPPQVLHPVLQVQDVDAGIVH